MKRIILGIVLLSNLVFGGQKFIVQKGDDFTGCPNKNDALMVDLVLASGDKARYQSYFKSKGCIHINPNKNFKFEVIKKYYIPLEKNMHQYII